VSYRRRRLSLRGDDGDLVVFCSRQADYAGEVLSSASEESARAHVRPGIDLKFSEPDFSSRFNSSLLTSSDLAGLRHFVLPLLLPSH
jgi:hypothetical protein